MSVDGSRLFDETLIARRRVRVRTAAAVGVLLLLRALGEVAPILRRPDLLLLDTWQSIRAQPASGQIAIVAIDEKSIARYGPPAWNRREFVPLVEFLARAGAKVIAFDFTFGALPPKAEPSAVEGNAQFAKAIKEAGNVAFGYEFVRVNDPSPPGVAPSAAVQASALVDRAPEKLVSVPPAPELIEPEPALAAAAAALGHVRVNESDDGRLRMLPLVIQHGDKSYPSLGVQVARLFQGAKPEDVRIGDGVVSIGPIDVPVRRSGEVLLNWPAGGRSAFKTYPFVDVLRGDYDPSTFRGKAVLVAGTASGLDDRDFPFAAKAPGVLVYASFLDNVFRGDFVRAPSWAFAFEWALLLALGVLAVWLLPLLPTRVLLVGVPAAALLVLGLSGFLYVQNGLALPSFYPVLALVFPLGTVVVLRLTASEKETRDVHAEKQENQKLLGLSFQEKGMLDLALATFDKLPMTEDMKLVYLNLGLDYENRGQRDKAFIAYKKVFDLDPRYENVGARIEKLRAAGAGTGAYVPPTIVPTAMPPSVPLPAVPAHGTPRAAAAPAAGAYVTATPATNVPGEAPTELAPGSTAGAPAASYQSPIPQQAPGTGGRHTPMASMGAAGASMTAAPGGGPLLPGSRIGKYEVERHLGRGGMGDVYLVRDTVINRKAALKTIREDNNLDSRQVIELRQRFYREGQTAGALQHPNIVTVYDLGEALGMSYIVMEYVEGQTLAQLMKRQKLSVAQIKHVVYHAAMGLDYAHKNGVFHRDVKPDNIMVSKTGNVKVMDFGIARVVESQLTQTGSVMGTPAYMSPEQVNGQKVDQRSDVFSLGVILYELLTGKKPFTGETVQSLMFAIVKDTPAQASLLDAKIGTAWDQLLAKALAKDRDQRYASARELAAAVRDAK